MIVNAGEMKLAFDVRVVALIDEASGLPDSIEVWEGSGSSPIDSVEADQDGLFESEMHIALWELLRERGIQAAQKG